MSNRTIYSIILLFFIGINAYSQPPLDPLVSYTSYNIATGNFDIRWNPSTDPNVAFYQVWYYYPKRGGLSGGWLNVIKDNQILASQDLSLSVDPGKLQGNNANPLLEPVVFGVQAFLGIDDNINVLEDYNFDSTIFLQAEYDSCRASADLIWNPYNFKQWNQPGTSAYRIYISNNNGANFSLAASVSNNTLAYSLKELKENENYIIFVSAISANNPGDSANSTPVYINTDMAILPDYMYANYATYENGVVGLSFSIDPLSETNTYNLLRSTAPDGAFESIYQFKTKEKELKYSDNTNYYNGPYYYKLEVINYCDTNISESENLASSILLKNNGSQLSPILNWNDYLNWTNGINSYVLERKFSNTEYNEIANHTSTSYTDTELAGLVENNYSAEVCYRVTAYENGGDNFSMSNPICYELPANIRFEYDAFMPGSGTGNDSFGPTIDFIPKEYSFKILDRSGRKVYESKDPTNTRWDGYVNGNLATEGAYMGVIQYRMSNGKRQLVHGAVVVVH